MAGRTVACFKQVRLHHEDSYGWTEGSARGPVLFCLVWTDAEKGMVSAAARTRGERSGTSLQPQQFGDAFFWKTWVLRQGETTWTSLYVFGLRGVHPLWHRQRFLRLKQLLKEQTQTEFLEWSLIKSRRRQKWTIALFIHRGADGWKRFKMSKITDKHKLVTPAKMILQALTSMKLWECLILAPLLCLVFSFVFFRWRRIQINVMKIRVSIIKSLVCFICLTILHLGWRCV